MGDKPAKPRAISPKAREKCIKRARKRVLFLDRWGYWFGIFFLIAGLAFIGLSICFIVFMIIFLENMPGNPPQFQNNMWEGFIFGMVFGFFVGLIGLKGGYYFAEGIKYHRGDPADRMLVEYHDALLNLMQNEIDVPKESS
jgi:hypothetical protein